MKRSVKTPRSRSYSILTGAGRAFKIIIIKNIICALVSRLRINFKM